MPDLATLPVKVDWPYRRFMSIALRSKVGISVLSAIAAVYPLSLQRFENALCL